MGTRRASAERRERAAVGGHATKSDYAALGGRTTLGGHPTTSDAGAPLAGWRAPSEPGAALATLDRMARYCEFSCPREVERCIEDDCEAWRLERDAAERVEHRLLDGQD